MKLVEREMLPFMHLSQVLNFGKDEIFIDEVGEQYMSACFGSNHVKLHRHNRPKTAMGYQCGYNSY